MRLFGGHTHRWSIVGVHKNTSTAYPETRVLETCKFCKKQRTRKLKGHWTLQQVRGESQTDRADPA